MTWSGHILTFIQTATMKEIAITAMQLNSIKMPLASSLLHNGRIQACIKTHDSESLGQEEAGHTRRMSELFIRSTAQIL